MIEQNSTPTDSHIIIDYDKLEDSFYEALQRIEEDKEVKTETLTIKARPLANGYVKAKTGDATAAETYDNWYSEVYQPAVGTA